MRMYGAAPTAVRDRPPVPSLDGARLKTAILAEGLRVTESARPVLAYAAKPMLRVRSGSCGGLDVVLSDGTYVNCPVRERFAADSPLTLVADGGELVIHDTRARFPDVVAAALPTPAYYGLSATDGTPLHRTGQLCSDRLGVGLTNICTYYRSKSSRCRFCSIGHNVSDEQSTKRLGSILEAVAAAYTDPVVPARHLLLGGGTPDGTDAGALAMAETARAIKRQWSQPIYAMLAPPRDLAYLDILRDSGVEEVAMNVEVFSEGAATKFVPGKRAANPLSHYLAALERAVELFGPVHTRSITVVGLEDAEETLKGVELLARRGVMPILSPLRPLAGTQLENHPRFAADALWDLTLRATELAEAHGIPLGPTCIACQSNTLTAPGHPLYRFY